MFFRNIKKVFKYGSKYRLSFILEIFGSIIGIAINILLPILAANQIVNITDNNILQIIYISIVILIVEILKLFSTLLIRKNTQKFYMGVGTDLQKDLTYEILKINQSVIDSKSTGMFVSRLTNDVKRMSTMFTVGVGYLVGVISNIGIFISIFIINKYVFMYYLLVTSILTIIHLIKTNKFYKKDKLERKQNERLVSIIGELIRGIRDIKMLNCKENFVNTLEDNIIDCNKKHLDMRNVDINYNFIIGIITKIFEFILILLLVYLININNITIPLALALFSYKDNVMSSFMEKISLLLEEINNFNLSCNRVFEILDGNTYKKELFGNKHLDNINGDISFNNVKFSYSDKVVLNNLSFDIKSCETIGFVGKSGSGKTTIFNLLCKMYDVNSGSIKIDGIDINKLDEDSVRSSITVINQSPYIFNMSIIDNLRLVKKDVSFEEVENACKIACIDDYINSLPDKYNTVLGEGGVNLSGGQRQRLAIARALLQKSKIILFDEATSALDNETQAKIQEAINNLKDDYTIIIIAHRFSTIVNCDRIYYIDKGSVLDYGTHNELLKRCNNYRVLYEAEIKED